MRIKHEGLFWNKPFVNVCYCVVVRRGLVCTSLFLTLKAFMETRTQVQKSLSGHLVLLLLSLLALQTYLLWTLQPVPMCKNRGIVQCLFLSKGKTKTSIWAKKHCLTLKMCGPLQTSFSVFLRTIWTLARARQTMFSDTRKKIQDRSCPLGQMRKKRHSMSSWSWKRSQNREATSPSPTRINKTICLVKTKTTQLI